MDTSVFFKPEDGFTVKGTISTLNVTVNGLFDQDLTDFNLDNSGPSQEKYLFVCQEFTDWRSAVGKTMTIGTASYTITNSVSDGTGLLTLSLYAG